MIVAMHGVARSPGPARDPRRASRRIDGRAAGAASADGVLITVVELAAMASPAATDAETIAREGCRNINRCGHASPAAHHDGCVWRGAGRIDAVCVRHPLAMWAGGGGEGGSIHRRLALRGVDRRLAPAMRGSRFLGFVWDHRYFVLCLGRIRIYGRRRSREGADRTQPARRTLRVM